MTLHFFRPKTKEMRADNAIFRFSCVPNDDDYKNADVPITRQLLSFLVMTEGIVMGFCHGTLALLYNFTIARNRLIYIYL